MSMYEEIEGAVNRREQQGKKYVDRCVTGLMALQSDLYTVLGIPSDTGGEPVRVAFFLPDFPAKPVHASAALSSSSTPGTDGKLPFEIGILIPNSSNKYAVFSGSIQAFPQLVRLRFDAFDGTFDADMSGTFKDKLAYKLANEVLEYYKSDLLEEVGKIAFQPPFSFVLR